jgi:putative transposase
MFLCTLPGFKSSGGKRRLTLAEFDVLLREFILDTYHERLHGETGVAPIQRWEQGGFLPRMPETLDLLLLTVPTARKVHPDGTRFQGLRYIDTTLAAYIGESVMLLSPMPGGSKAITRRQCRRVSARRRSRLDRHGTAGTA